MRFGIALMLITPIVLAGTPRSSYAAAPAAGLVPAEGGATFRFTTSVQTPKGTHAGSGTITIKKTGPGAISLTIQTDDGKPSRTIPLIVGVDGSVAPDPTGNATTAPSDPTVKTQAQAFTAEMTIAAHVGIGARKNGGAASYTIPVSLAPVGEGDPVKTQLTMNG